MSDKLHFNTRVIHAGQEPDPVTGAVVPPIYQVSTYKQDGVGGLRGKGLKTQPLRLHGWRWFAFAAIVLWLIVTVAVPLFGITLRSFVVTWGEGVKLLDVLTLDHYRELSDYPNVIRGILNTLGIGVIGGAVAVACYTAIALAVHRWNSGWTRLVDYIVMVPRAMPGLVAGLALLWVFLFVPFLSPAKETMVSIWVAYSIVWLAYGMRLVSSSKSRRPAARPRPSGMTRRFRRQRSRLPPMRGWPPNPLSGISKLWASRRWN